MDEMPKKELMTLLAIGGAGCRILRRVAESSAADRLRLLAVDTDASALEALALPGENTLLAAARWRAGRGCGGNTIDGQRAVAHERSRLEKMLSGSEFLVVVGGLGGGTASGGAPVVLSVARKLGIATMFLMTLPFSLEGHSKRKIAEETVREELLELADAVLCLPNDLLFSVLAPTTPLAEAFRLADEQVSRALLALTAVLGYGNLLAPEFGSFAALLRRKKSFCSIGVGVAKREEDGVAWVEKAMDRLLASPLLGGADKLGAADAVIFSLLGGPELSIGDAKAALELASSHMRGETQMVVGASTGEEWAGMMQLTAVTVRFDAENEVAQVMQKAAERTPRRSRSGGAGEDASQLTLPFLETVSKGIMEKTAPVFWENEDLDIPTFKRRNATVDNGKTARE